MSSQNRAIAALRTSGLQAYTNLMRKYDELKEQNDEAIKRSEERGMVGKFAGWAVGAVESYLTKKPISPEKFATYSTIGQRLFGGVPDLETEIEDPGPYHKDRQRQIQENLSEYEDYDEVKNVEALSNWMSDYMLVGGKMPWEEGFKLGQPAPGLTEFLRQIDPSRFPEPRPSLSGVLEEEPLSGAALEEWFEEEFEPIEVFEPEFTSLGQWQEPLPPAPPRPSIPDPPLDLESFDDFETILVEGFEPEFQGFRTSRPEIDDPIVGDLDEALIKEFGDDPIYEVDETRLYNQLGYDAPGQIDDQSFITNSPDSIKAIQDIVVPSDTLTTENQFELGNTVYIDPDKITINQAKVGANNPNLQGTIVGYPERGEGDLLKVRINDHDYFISPDAIGVEPFTDKLEGLHEFREWLEAPDYEMLPESYMPDTPEKIGELQRYLNNLLRESGKDFGGHISDSLVVDEILGDETIERLMNLDPAMFMNIIGSDQFGDIYQGDMRSYWGDYEGWRRAYE